MRWPEGPPHLALNTPCFFFVLFVFVLLAKDTETPQKAVFPKNRTFLQSSSFLSFLFSYFLSFGLSFFHYFFVSCFFFPFLSLLSSFLCFLLSFFFLCWNNNNITENKLIGHKKGHIKNTPQQKLLCCKITSKSEKVISLATGVPAWLLIKVLLFQNVF